MGLTRAEIKAIDEKIDKMSKMCTSNRKEIYIEGKTAKELIEILQKCVVEDANATVGIESGDDYCEPEFFVQTSIEETIEKFEERKNNYRDFLIKQKLEKKNTASKKLEQERALYERLKRKFEQKSPKI